MEGESDVLGRWLSQIGDDAAADGLLDVCAAWNSPELSRARAQGLRSLAHKDAVVYFFHLHKGKLFSDRSTSESSLFKFKF